MCIRDRLRAIKTCHKKKFALNIINKTYRINRKIIKHEYLRIWDLINLSNSLIVKEVSDSRFYL